MLLVEIAEQYAESAERVRVQIQRLRAAEAPSPYIENKMREVYRDLRRAERACRSYYERGYWLDEEFRADYAERNCPRKPAGRTKVSGRDGRGQCGKASSAEKKTAGSAVQVAGETADVLIGVLFGAPDDGAAGGAVRGK